jgi:phenylacetate-CoA ligase
MASVKGAYLKHIRYDESTIERIEGYIEREKWGKEKWQTWIEERLQRTLYNAKKYVPYYKDYWSSNRSSYEILDNWPIITKHKINEFPDRFIDSRYKKIKLYHDHTSGTTGTPLDIYLDYDSVKEQYALFEARVKKKYSIELDEAWAIIGAQRVADINRQKPPFWVYNYASSQLYLSSLHIAQWTVSDYVNALMKYQPQYMIGYTNSIYEFAREMLEKKLKYKMKAIITNAEPLKGYHEKIIAKAFECPIVETYGQAELVSFASRFPNGKMYESPEMGITEIIDIDSYENDEYGRLVATGMLNKAMPLIRYDTNDLISIETYQSEGFLPEYGKILGRKDDIIVLEDGRKIVQIDGIFSSELGIIEGQIIQEDFSDFTINIVPGVSWNDDAIDKINKKLIERLGNVNINVEICKKIEKTWAGKFRVIQSNMHINP